MWKLIHKSAAYSGKSKEFIMRQKIKTNASLTFLIVAFSIASCTSTNMKRSNEARTSLQTMDNDIKSAVRQLEITGVSLDKLIESGQNDMKEAFNTYSDNVLKIVAIEEKFEQHADEMTVRGADYFEEWQKEGTEYKNPRIQQLSDQRRAELGEVYGLIAENSIGVSEAFKAYVSDVKEIQMFLSNDLTAKGIAAIAPTSEKVVSDGDSLEYALQNMQSAIQRTRTEMSQSSNDI